MIIKLDDKKLINIRSRGIEDTLEYENVARDIVNDVRKSGDSALFKYTEKFDKFKVNSDNVLVSELEIDTAISGIDDKFISSLERARDNIISFHRHQLEKTWYIETAKGSLLGQKITPLERVAIYVPGGKASYFSSVLMNALPALVAGVDEIIMLTPANHGNINPKVLLAAKLAGVSKIYKVGGAQAISAAAYGTESISKVDKIVGPGNIYVAMAKKLVFGSVDIDMIAGPSEILIIADSSANPKRVAADMLAQLEHDELASAITITNDKTLAIAIEVEVKEQLKSLPKREIAEKSLANYGAIILVSDLLEAAEFSNSFAPEHLELYIKSPLEFLKYIRHAGAIFLGENSPEVVGDYYAGPNHVLPTGGSARFFSPLGTYDFIKRSSVIYYTEDQLKSDSDDIIRLATDEGLIGHANSILFRK